IVGFTAPTAADKQRARELDELAAMIPTTSSVAVSEEEMPHVSGRPLVLTLKYTTSNADYLLYGARSVGAAVAMKALEDKAYVEAAKREYVMLLKRNQ
ncbi:MAG TPA: hypothetical protein VJT73_19255, partial [Polyangiaceae bacterium]|nr:hypothetical protein [Polyangiaceae bacterium]